MAPKLSAAIPFRHTASGELELLLVTSRRKQLWIIPKGNVRGMLPCVSAAREAFEEAGVHGVISHRPLGTYRQRKTDSTDGRRDIIVAAYPLFVNTLLRSWPEMDVRVRRWLPALEAIDLVEKADLRVLLEQFTHRYSTDDPPV